MCYGYLVSWEEKKTIDYKHYDDKLPESSL